MNGAQVLVQHPEQHGVTQVFGIPGAKVVSVFETLLDSLIELVLCRHEQNAATSAGDSGASLADLKRIQHVHQDLIH